MRTPPTRRQLITGALASSFLPPFLRSPPLAGAQHQAKPPPLGVHLPLWNKNNLSKDLFWNQLFKELKTQNIKHCLILIYRFVDPITGSITAKSKYKNTSAPDIDFLKTGLKAAQSHDIKASLYPVLEIDNQENIGHVWRAFLNFFGVTLENFFHAYSNHMQQLAKISATYEAPSFYIGSELASLTHNTAAAPHWEQLIYELRGIINQSTKLTYAANWEEYLTVPFWRQLDEIGIDAYFPLVSQATARGINRPSQNELEASLSHKLKTLKSFAQSHKRPLSLSEFGLTPFDETTAHPWQRTPSNIKDPTERLTAYKALFKVLKNEGTWLSSVNLWHWQLPNRKGSPYNITPNTPLAELIKNYTLSNKR